MKMTDGVPNMLRSASRKIDQHGFSTTTAETTAHERDMENLVNELARNELCKCDFTTARDTEEAD